MTTVLEVAANLLRKTGLSTLARQIPWLHRCWRKVGSSFLRNQRQPLKQGELAFVRLCVKSNETIRHGVEASDATNHANLAV